MFRGHTVEGQLILPPEADAYLRRIHDEPVLIEVSPVWSRRSVPQNRRQWGAYNRALKRVSTLLPCTKEELHDAVKNRSEVIQPARLYFPNGSVIGDAKLSRTLPVSRFGDFMEETSALFASGGIDLYEAENERP